MAGLSDKQRKALQEKAAKEAAERAAREGAGTGRRRKKPIRDGIQGPPPGLVAVLILLLMIGGAIALGFWLSSADSPLGTPSLPEDFGTSEDKGGYISDEGLPKRGSVNNVSENPAAADNVTAEEAQGGEPGEDGGQADSSTDQDPGMGEFVSVHVMPYMMGGASPEDYAAARGWTAGVLQEDGSMVYSVTAEQQAEAVSQAKAEMDALMANVASTGVIDSVSYADESSYGTFTAYAFGGHEADRSGWSSALEPILAKSAERSALAGSNNPAPSATVYAGSPDAEPVVAGSVFLVSGEAVANVSDAG